MTRAAVVAAVSILLLVACSPTGEGASPSGRGATPPPSTTAMSLASPAPSAACAPTTVAIDPGHNPVPIDDFDPVTGVAEIDYPNGAEDRDVFAVAEQVRDMLVGFGYRVILLKRAVGESVTYRQRVQRAAGATIAVSIHTSPGVNAVFAQRVGLYREGIGADGRQLRVTFTNRATAARSERYAHAVAEQRTRIEGRPVAVRDNDFGRRAPLWSGNIPVIALIADTVPWVYNEFGTPDAGGSTGLPRARLDAYARGLVAGVRSAVPVCVTSR